MFRFLLCVCLVLMSNVSYASFNLVGYKKIVNALDKMVVPTYSTEKPEFHGSIGDVFEVSTYTYKGVKFYEQSIPFEYDITVHFNEIIIKPRYRGVTDGGWRGTYTKTLGEFQDQQLSLVYTAGIIGILEYYLGNDYPAFKDLNVKLEKNYIDGHKVYDYKVFITTNVSSAEMFEAERLRREKEKRK